MLPLLVLSHVVDPDPGLHRSALIVVRWIGIWIQNIGLKTKRNSILPVFADEWNIFSKDDINVWASLKIFILTERLKKGPIMYIFYVLLVCL
jgi:hypothetical protein